MSERTEQRTERGAQSLRFRYRAANAAGGMVEGEIDADSEQNAIDALRRRSLWATDVWSSQSNSAPRERRGVPSGALATTTRALSSLIASGVTLENALDYAAKNAAGSELKAAFSNVRNDVRNGRTLRDAFAAQPLFPNVFAALAAAGEATGSLDKALDRLAEHLEKTDQLRARMRSALLYPALLAIAASIGTSIIMLVVVPRFAVLLQQAGSAIPLSTRILVAISSVAKFAVPVLIVAGLLVALSWRRWLGAPEQRLAWQNRLLHWPLIGGFERARAAARYSRVLALALPGGIDLLSAMSLARVSIDNLALQGRYAEAESRVRSGASLSVSLASVLPPLAVQLLGAGEASGALGALASRAADALDEELQQSLSRIVTLVEPVLILAFGGLIGFVALGLLQAIYGMNASTL